VAYLTDAPIDLAAFLGEARPGDGALCLFVGVVRNENEGRPTVAIQYEAYEPMAESEMARIGDGLSREFPAVKIRMKHRVGRLTVGEPSVAIAAVAPHRAEAFAACRAAIDRVKATVPIWKKEFHPDGSSDWVDTSRTGA
jgi:molybdopterin synthase catalytic subunit